MRILTQAPKLPSSQAPKSDLFKGIGEKEKVPIYDKSMLSVGEMMMNGQRYLFNLIVDENNEKEGDASWSVYPNPASDFINLQGPSGQVKGESMDIEIMNSNGQTVYSSEGMSFHKDGNRISIRNLTSGMYILRLRTTDEEIQLPFVKIRP